MQKDDKKGDQKKEEFEWSLTIYNISDFDQIVLDPPHWQFTAEVRYVRGDNSNDRWVDFAGHGRTEDRIRVPAGNAGASGSLYFPLTFDVDTTACTLTSVLWDMQMDGMILKEATPRQWVDFIGPGLGGMGVAARGGPAEWKTEVAAAVRTAVGKNTIAAGLYRGKFKQFDKLFRACARILIQGEPPVLPVKKGPPPCLPLKLEYDLPADVHWHKVGNKYQPFWSFCNLTPLAASPKFRTIMRPVLLNADGKVESITTHPY
jgi:hypothetical protein